MTVYEQTTQSNQFGLDVQLIVIVDFQRIFALVPSSEMCQVFHDYQKSSSTKGSSFIENKSYTHTYIHNIRIESRGQSGLPQLSWF